jgi:alkanesulfonate monooxygenase SsuD/methylene tetrahydromethanopterin reductase-like flavin-dependent oxidoreductase (luciferase family)
MSGLGIGFTLLSMEDPKTGDAPRWEILRRRARLAEDVGFDTVWIADELQWEMEAWDDPRNWWECVALAGAVAASTDSINVGTWVLSALHRNPGITLRAAETLDEISGGRFVFGLGAGHAGRQGEAFGFPSTYTVSRYEEALAIITALRNAGHVSFGGVYYTAQDQVLGPRSSREEAIPLLLGAHGPRTMRLAVENADIWSAYATESSQPESFVDMIDQLNRICDDLGRDPRSLGRSIGVAVAPPDIEPTGWLADAGTIKGSTDQIIDTFGRFEALGCTRLEVMAAGNADEVIEGLAPVVEAFGPNK